MVFWYPSNIRHIVEADELQQKTTLSSIPVSLEQETEATVATGSPKLFHRTQGSLSSSIHAVDAKFCPNHMHAAAEIFPKHTLGAVISIGYFFEYHSLPE